MISAARVRLLTRRWSLVSVRAPLLRVQMSGIFRMREQSMWPLSPVSRSND